MPQRHPVQPVHCPRPRKEIPSGQPGHLLQIAGAELGSFRNTGQPERIGQRADELLFAVRIRSPQLMVEMKDYQLDLELRSQPQQDVQQNDGIGAARNRDANAGTGRDHVITSDDFRHPVY